MNTTIKEIPLLFQTEMVQAILADRKTQTRRTKGLDYLNNPNYFKEFDSMEHVVSLDGKERYGIMLNLKRDPGMGVFIKYPYGKPGDLLWVRETYLKLDTDHTMDGKPYYYKASFDAGSEDLRQDYIKSGYDYRWKPSIHMPKAASRIWLMVEEIRVERLQDISEEDAVAEGIKELGIYSFPIYKDYLNSGMDGYQTPQWSFRSLWISINGQVSLSENPWVWVVKFRVLSKTGRPSDQVIEQNWKEVTQ